MHAKISDIPSGSILTGVEGIPLSMPLQLVPDTPLHATTVNWYFVYGMIPSVILNQVSVSVV